MKNNAFARILKIFIIFADINFTNSLNISENTDIKNNSASVAYTIKETDKSLHQANIKTEHFTAPFKYAYNNYDINYLSDVPPVLLFPDGIQ